MILKSARCGGRSLEESDPATVKSSLRENRFRRASAHARRFAEGQVFRGIDIPMYAGVRARV
jgi:hypothetical protein